MRILIVEDDETSVELLTLVLNETIKADIQAVSTNAKAKELLERNDYDLVLTDLNHPDEHGIKLVEWIRAHPKMFRIPVVVQSGNFSDAEELQLYRYGKLYVLRKPFRIDELLLRVRDFLGLPEDRVRDLVRIGRESQSLDYKRGFSLAEKKSRASLAKDVIAMANTAGGNIVVGVAEITPGEFLEEGLEPKILEQFEITRLSDALRVYIGSLVKLDVERARISGKWFISISVNSSGNVVMPLKENAEAGLFLGRIYVRTEAARTEELRDPLDLQALFERVVRARAAANRD